MDFTHINPFEVELKELNYLDIADWLTYLRTLVKREAFDTNDQYYEELELLVQDWKMHYASHQADYKTVKFRKALLVCQIKENINFEIDYGLGKEPFSIDTYQSVLQGSIFKDRLKVEDDFQVVVDTMLSDIEAIFKAENVSNYKNLLHEVVSSQRFNWFTTTYRILSDGIVVSAKSYKELLDKIDGCKFETKRVKRVKKKSYKEALLEFDISNSSYNEFTNSFRCEKHFDKKLFVNLSFVLALPYEWAERLLQYNGYTLKSNGRIFDEVMSITFKLGLSREMAISLIDKKNQDLDRLSKGNFIPVPNIAKNRK